MFQIEWRVNYIREAAQKKKWYNCIFHYVHMSIVYRQYNMQVHTWYVCRSVRWKVFLCWKIKDSCLQEMGFKRKIIFKNKKTQGPATKLQYGEHALANNCNQILLLLCGIHPETIWLVNNKPCKTTHKHGRISCYLDFSFILFIQQSNHSIWWAL